MRGWPQESISNVSQSQDNENYNSRSSLLLGQGENDQTESELKADSGSPSKRHISDCPPSRTPEQDPGNMQRDHLNVRIKSTAQILLLHSLEFFSQFIKILILQLYNW